MWRHDDYECSSCENVFEEMTKDDSKVPCPSCGADNTKRLIASPRIDWKKMGMDPAFPSAYDKWGAEQTRHHTRSTER